MIKIWKYEKIVLIFVAKKIKIRHLTTAPFVSFFMKTRHKFLTALSAFSLMAASSYAQNIGTKLDTFVEGELKPIFRAVAVATFIIGFLFVIGYIFFAESGKSKKVIMNVIIACAVLATLSGVLAWVKGIV